MKPGQFRMILKPLLGGSFTQWRLFGSTVTPVPHAEMQRLIEQLSFWSGWPVELVLPVDIGADAWFEWWTNAMTDIPADHLQVRFVINRPSPSRESREPRKSTDSAG